MHWQIYSFRNRSFIQYWMKGIIITDKLLKFHQVLFFISPHIYLLSGFWFFSYLLSSSRETSLQLHNMLHHMPVGDEIWSPMAYGVISVHGHGIHTYVSFHGFSFICWWDSDCDGELICCVLLLGSIVIIHDGSYMPKVAQDACSAAVAIVCGHTGNNNTATVSIA